MAGADEINYISAVLRSGDHKTGTLAGVDPGWFYSYRQEWQWIEAYAQEHLNVPPKPVFRQRFPDFGIVKVDDIEASLKFLRKSHVHRSVGFTIEALAEMIGSDSPADDLLDRAAEEIMTLQLGVTGGLNETEIIGDFEHVLDVVRSRYRRAQARGMAGIPTGFPSLDTYTSGPQPGDMWVVAARLGHGKTWTGIRMACSAVARNYKVQFDALEQSRAQVAMRAHSFLSAEYGSQQFPAMSLMQGSSSLDLIAYEGFVNKLPDMAAGKLFVNDTSRGRVTPATIASQIERNKPDIVYVDYLTLMNSGGDGRDWKHIADLSADIKGLARRYEIPIVCMAQLNRGVPGRADLPGAEHLAGADAIGQDADAVITMVQQSKRVLKFKLAKYRHGGDGQTWYVEFAPNSGRMVEIAGDAARDLIDEDLADANLD
jgi:replicative DNA helicase